MRVVVRQGFYCISLLLLLVILLFLFMTGLGYSALEHFCHFRLILDTSSNNLLDTGRNSVLHTFVGGVAVTFRLVHEVVDRGQYCALEVEVQLDHSATLSLQHLTLH